MRLLAMNPLLFLMALGIAASAINVRADEGAERGALLQQRTALDAQLARDIQVCEARFAVNACLEGLRVRHNAAISPLTEKLDAIDARERVERAAEQKARVAERQREFAADEGRRLTDALKAPVAAKPAETAASTTPRTPRAVDPEVRAVRLQKQALANARTAQNNRDQLAERQRQQQLREQAQQQRAEARARSGKKPGVALPLPTAAEVAAAVASARSAPRR